MRASPPSLGRGRGRAANSGEGSGPCATSRPSPGPLPLPLLRKGSLPLARERGARLNPPVPDPLDGMVRPVGRPSRTRASLAQAVLVAPAGPSLTAFRPKGARVPPRRFRERTDHLSSHARGSGRGRGQGTERDGSPPPSASPPPPPFAAAHGGGDEASFPVDFPARTTGGFRLDPACRTSRGSCGGIGRGYRGARRSARRLQIPCSAPLFSLFRADENSLLSGSNPNREGFAAVLPVGLADASGGAGFTWSLKGLAEAAGSPRRPGAGSSRGLHGNLPCSGNWGNREIVP